MRFKSSFPGVPGRRRGDAETRSEHETLVVDIASYEQMVEAAREMDAIVNCTVIRNDPVKSFDVNVQGAYNVMKAAVKHGIRRVVHTGPQLAMHEFGQDFDVTEDCPPRPGTALYGLTKYLGQEVCRIFAEEYDIQVVVLLFSSFRDADEDHV